MLQAYIDDSTKGDLFVLAGYISTAERWAAFSDEWQRLLDMRSPHYRSLEYFKMSEMSSEGDRERCAWFTRVIEDHVTAAVAYTVAPSVFRRLAREIFPDMARTVLENPFHFAFSGLIARMALNQRELGFDSPVQFIFDQTSARKRVLAGWETLKYAIESGSPEAGRLVGGPPLFRDDQTTLPLQAADLLAWWMREWQTDRINFKDSDAPEGYTFPWGSEREVTLLCIAPTEDDLRRRFEGIRALQLARRASRAAEP